MLKKFEIKFIFKIDYIISKNMKKQAKIILKVSLKEMKKEIIKYSVMVLKSKQVNL